MVVRWSVEGKFEVLEKENGLYDVNVLHPYSTGIKNCISAAVRFVFLYHCRVALPTIILCVREKKTQNMMNIYSAIPQRTRSGEKVNLFCFCLILLFSLMFIPHSLF